ncbi:hypothetical protein HK104_008379 [Borealophlyctis nickersoniae]|nr:hypothetical protein HK104_008379 [Borealophlyctis nickersoniae]
MNRDPEYEAALLRRNLALEKEADCPAAKRKSEVAGGGTDDCGAATEVAGGGADERGAAWEVGGCGKLN